MEMERKRYLMVVPISAHRIDGHRFAIESAFAEHLRMLRRKLEPIADELVVAGPSLTADDFERNRAQLATIDEHTENIRFKPMFTVNASRMQYVKTLPRILRNLYHEIQRASVVHASTSGLYRPFEFPALLIARAAGKKTISVTDIDRRENARMNLLTGHWDKRQYLVTRLLHDPFESLQQSICARACSLVLLKGAKLAADYGRGRHNVKNFLDAAFSESQLIDADRLHAKAAAIADRKTRVELSYFGRLVEYKGVDAMLRALALAKGMGLHAFHFHVIGAGEAETSLRTLCRERGLESDVTFHGMLPFGETLFDELHRYHLLLAAPLRQDTPRSALDAMASGQAVLAYDTYYYKELAAAGAPVHVVPWRDEQALATRLLQLCDDRERLARDMRAAVDFARANTQEVWIDRRVQWTIEACAG